MARLGLDFRGFLISLATFWAGSSRSPVEHDNPEALRPKITNGFRSGGRLNSSVRRDGSRQFAVDRHKNHGDNLRARQIRGEGEHLFRGDSLLLQETPCSSDYELSLHLAAHSSAWAGLKVCNRFQAEVVLFRGANDGARKGMLTGTLEACREGEKCILPEVWNHG